jgi:uncharacterized repeat protein (TIGR01451 family)
MRFMAFRLGPRLVALAAAALACAGVAPARGAVSLDASFSSDATAVTLVSSAAIHDYTVGLCSGPLPKIQPLGTVRTLRLGPYGSPIVSVLAKAGARTLLTQTGVRCPPRSRGAVDLALAESLVPDGPLVVGERISYTLTVRNNGPETAMNVVVEDTLPSGLSFLSASAAGACSGGQAITCSLGHLEAGASTSVAITAIAVSPGPIVATASVSAAGSDTHPGDDSVVVSSTILGVLAPPVTKSCDAVRVAPKKLVIGVPASLRVTVTARGKPVSRARVVVKGGGVTVSARTGADGVARAAIVPRRAGPLEVRVAGEPTCGGRTIAVLAA